MPNSPSPKRHFQIKHGHCRRSGKSRTYIAWQNMLQRCTNPNRPGFPFYGDRGIVVCKRWRHSFANFLHDMGECPKGLEIERINNARGYGPGNCVWGTDHIQSRNRRSNRVLTVLKRTACFVDLCRFFKIHPATASDRIKRGWSLKRAFLQPIDKRCWKHS